MSPKGSATKRALPKSPKGTIVRPEGSPRIEVEESRKPDPDDFFKPTNKKDPNFHYHWAENTPRRVHAMKRKGYEIDPTSSSEEAHRKASNQREYLKRTMHDPDTPKENAEMAKELLNRMESAPVDTVTNITGHVLMRQPMEERIKTMQRREDISNKMKDRLEADIRDMDKAMKRSGQGGMKAFTDMFDKIRDRQGG
jgi:flagellar biosynthesis GTPase FlhF